ncbi:ale1 [Candida oxycetoniae]|uniref:Ale1 n=1 Tax=Candida oxycetoniae TaxID=497107 RepID=A0AAI9SUT3_9ASCO|nr:ale1 [Candida oxycetoniae]KAI3403463.2 ale1 [Candida oxycetoniae]
MISAIQILINSLSDITGLDQASIKILTCTLLSFGFSIIFKRLPDQNYTLKNIYNVLVSAFYVFGICDLRSGLGTLLISSLGTYFITRYLRTSKMPWVNFLFLMIHMAYSHVHLQFFDDYDPTVIDITGAQMILVMKLSAFGWSVHDGKQPRTSLNEYNKSRAIYKHPNILPYIGYSFFYASLLTGPAFDYVDYDKFMHSTLFDDVPEEKRPGRRVKRRIPRSGKQAFVKLLQGFFWAFLLFQVPKFADLKYVFKNEFVTDHGFVYRIFYMWVLGFSYRLKYYAIWTIAEGACILCGIGYNGFDSETGEFKWNRVQNIDPVAFETGQSVHACLEAWNQNTNKWLKYYVYLRVAKPGKKPGFKSTVFTFATSAFWHGTRPGYYLTFVLGALLQTVGKYYRRNIRPFFLKSDGSSKPTKVIYDFVCWINTQLAFGFIVQPFVILDFKNSLLCWKTVNYWLVWVIGVSFFIYNGPLARYFKVKAPSPPKKKPVSDNPAENAPSTFESVLLSNEENRHVSHAVKKKLEKDYDAPTLGLPSFDVFQDMDREEIDDDIKHLHDAWVSFKQRKFLNGKDNDKNDDKNDDFEGLKDAYKNFIDEINRIFQSEKKEVYNMKEKILTQL